MSKYVGSYWWVAALLLIVVLLATGAFGEDQPKQKKEPPKSITAVEGAQLVLGIAINKQAEPVDEARLHRTLSRFAYLSKGKIKAESPLEMKAAFFLAALAEWVRHNEEQAVLLQAKTAFDAEYGKGE